MIKEIGIGGPRYGWERNATRECEEVPWTSRGFLSISQGDGWAWKQISTFYRLPSYNSIALIKKLVAHANLNFEISSRVDLRGVPWTASWRVAGAWRESSWNRGGRHIGKERKENAKAKRSERRRHKRWVIVRCCFMLLRTWQGIKYWALMIESLHDIFGSHLVHDALTVDAFLWMNFLASVHLCRLSYY